MFLVVGVGCWEVFYFTLGEFFVLVWFLAFCCCSFGLGFFGDGGAITLVKYLKILTSLWGSKIHIGRENCWLISTEAPILVMCSERC